MISPRTCNLPIELAQPRPRRYTHHEPPEADSSVPKTSQSGKMGYERHDDTVLHCPRLFRTWRAGVSAQPAGRSLSRGGRAAGELPVQAGLNRALHVEIRKWPIFARQLGPAGRPDGRRQARLPARTARDFGADHIKRLGEFGRHPPTSRLSVT